MKTAAGLLVWRYVPPSVAASTPGAPGGRRTQIEVLLAHLGGPLFARKDAGAWSIPKGEFSADTEDALDAARREFAEEIGQPAPAGAVVALGSARQPSGKVNTMWALEGDLDVSVVTSNTFELVWPPRSGRLQSFPEVDRADWFPLPVAHVKIFKAQRVFLDRLADQLAG